MGNLDDLGIACEYDPRANDFLKYSVNVNLSDFETPNKLRDCYRTILDVVADDAVEKGGLKNMRISVNREAFNGLRDVNKQLLYQAGQHKEMRENPLKTPKLSSLFEIVPAISLGFVGFVYGYGLSTEFATDVAEYFNNQSHLLAPITGLSQLGISVLGTGLSAGGLGMVGRKIGKFVISPYTKHKTPLADRFEKYESLDLAFGREEGKILNLDRTKRNRAS